MQIKKGKHGCNSVFMDGKSCEALFIGNNTIFRNAEQTVFNDLNVASFIEGFEGAALMPDCHSGYALPIGSVVAINAHSGGVYPMGIGVDISCGMRLILTPFHESDIDSGKIRKLLANIESKIPTGSAHRSNHAFIGKKTSEFVEELLQTGLPAIKNTGMFKTSTRDSDFENVEESSMKNNFQTGMNHSEQRMFEDGIANSLGTLGGGNHFIEIQSVCETDSEISKVFGLFPGQIVVMIHSGSRNFGYYVGNRYTVEFALNAQKKKQNIPGPVSTFNRIKNIPVFSYACIGTPEFDAYYAAQCACVNYGVANRHVMMQFIRESFSEVFKKTVEMPLLYDISHNIGKFEEHGGKNLFIIRKGATRAIPAGHPMLRNTQWNQTGHPVIIPGSMGASSYVLVGDDNIRTYCSVNHGAGRRLGRRAAVRQISEDRFKQSIKGVVFDKRVSKYLDEAPDAYKNIDDVIDSVVSAKIAKTVARMRPIGVIKGV